MKVTPDTRRALAVRRHHREMLAAGWTLAAEPRWQLSRGGEMHLRIADARPHDNGMDVWIKLEPREKGVIA